MERGVRDVGDPVRRSISPAVDDRRTDAVAAGVDDLAIGDPDAAQCFEMHEAAPLAAAGAAAVEHQPVSVMWSARRAASSEGPSVNTSRVAPRTPTICAPAGSLMSPAR